MQEQKKVVIFDCDGTVLDTFKLIEQVVIKTFKEVLPDYPMTEEEAHTFFGPFLNDSFQKYVDTKEEVEYCVKRYRYYCDLLTPNYVTAYDGILELLKKLKEEGYILCMVSNKVTPAIVMGLDLCHLTSYFDFIVGAEMLKKAKPNPDGIYQVMHHYKVENTVLIGDTMIDRDTAKNAGISFIGVTWCQTTKQMFQEKEELWIAEHPLEIEQFLKQIFSKSK